MDFFAKNTELAGWAVGGRYSYPPTIFGGLDQTEKL